MKVYFSAAIVQKEVFGKTYGKIVKLLKDEGHDLFQDTTEVSLQEVMNKSDDQRVRYYKKVLKWIAKADVVVLETSFPSTLHIGHEISLASQKGKPVVALYMKGHEPSFFLGREDEKLFWVEYEEDNVIDELKYALKLASEAMDTRFNFFISPKIANFLDWVSKTKRLPRAVYLRNLIQDKMEADKEYQS